MRRLWCFLLLTAFGMPFVAPLLANAQGVEALLPACCRRAGKHHCAMGAMPGVAVSGTEDQSPRWTGVSSKCPCCPTVARAFAHHEVAMAASAQPVAYLEFARPLGKAQTESRRRISRERSRYKRGPPVSFLA